MLEIGLFSSFIAGLLAFISPCVLPLVPVYIGMMSSKAIYRNESIKMIRIIYGGSIQKGETSIGGGPIELVRPRGVNANFYDERGRLCIWVVPVTNAPQRMLLQVAQNS